MLGGGLLEAGGEAYHGMFSRSSAPEVRPAPSGMFGPGRSDVAMFDVPALFEDKKVDDEKTIMSWLDSDATAFQAFRQEPAEAQEWHGQALPSQLVLHVEATPEVLLAWIKDFLMEPLPAQLLEDASEPWRLQAVAFVDYAPHQIEVQVYRRGGAATAQLRSAGRLEAVHLHQIARLLSSFLNRRGVQVCAPSPSAASLSGLLDDDDFADTLGDDEDFWCEHWGVLLEEALHAKRAEVREESAQSLARQADGSERLVALAKAMASQRDPLVRVLREAATTSLAQAFPLAAALQLAAACRGAAGVLAAARLDEACGGEGAPALVGRTLSAAAVQIRKASADAGAASAVDGHGAAASSRVAGLDQDVCGCESSSDAHLRPPTPLVSNAGRLSSLLASAAG